MLDLLIGRRFDLCSYCIRTSVILDDIMLICGIFFFVDSVIGRRFDLCLCCIGKNIILDGIMLICVMCRYMWHMASYTRHL